MEVSRYIHLNPVRTKMVASPEDWLWSSYLGYQQARRALEWATYGRVLGAFGSDSAQARRAYTQFVRTGLDDPPPSPFATAVGGLLVGSQAFVDRVKQLLGDQPEDQGLPELKRLRGRPSLERIVEVVAAHFGGDGWARGRRSDDAGRAVAAYLARARFGHAATDVAEALGYCGPSSVSHAVRRIERGGEAWREILKALESQLNQHYSLFKL